jgi:hypothetical protein
MLIDAVPPSCKIPQVLDLPQDIAPLNFGLPIIFDGTRPGPWSASTAPTDIVRAGLKGQ